MQAVIDGQSRLLQSWGRHGFKDLLDSELTEVEEGYKMSSVAANACKALLAAARAELSAAKDAKQPGTASVHSIGIASAYRSIAYDTEKYKETFALNYEETRAARATLPGGPHGDAAVDTFILDMKGRKAPPGWSNHSNGMAVDFKTKVGATTYTALKAQRPQWPSLWLHQWLVRNARQHGFSPLKTEEWHWDYH